MYLKGNDVNDGVFIELQRAKEITDKESSFNWVDVEFVVDDFNYGNIHFTRMNYSLICTFNSNV